jgi:hypothetical protein
MRYRNADGRIVKESSGTTNKQEAERFLRQRLDARDDGNLPTILSSKNLDLTEWAEWFLERGSKPPFRAEKTHLQNRRIVELLRPLFGERRLSDITPEAIEQYLAQRLRSRRKVHTKLGIQ